MGDSSAVFAVIHASLQSNEPKLTVKELCQIAGVSRSGYYNWVLSEKKRKQKELRDLSDFDLILEAYRFRGYDKGIRGIHMRLLHMNPSVRMNTKKINRLMHKYGLKCPIRKANPYRRMANALKTDVIADNLLQREFTEHGARKILLTDITYLNFKDDHLYLSVIMDAYTRQVLAYELSNSLYEFEQKKNFIDYCGWTILKI